MKYLSFTLLILGLTLVFSCNDSDPVMDDIGCDNNFAQYAYNDSLITTSFMANESDVLTPDGVNCGIGAVIEESTNRLTLRIHTEGHSVTIGVVIDDLNEPLWTKNITYIDNEFDSPLLGMNDSPTSIIITELDSINNMISGTFDYIVYGPTPQTSTISGGEFTCQYQTF